MAYIGASPTTSAFVTDTFNGNGSTVAFTMSVAPANTTSIIVAVSGVLQDPSTYSVSGTTLTFSAAPPSGTGNISVRFLGIPASGVTSTAYRTQTEFTATAGQTTFSVPSYTVGYIDVYRNGARLNSADYTATSGTTVVLASGASSGDSVTTESFYVSSVLNAIPAVAGAVTSSYILDGNVTQAKLASGVAGNGPSFYAWKSAGNQSISSGTWTTITLETEVWDTASCFASNKFTPNVAGYYQINGAITFTGSGIAGNRAIISFWKNGGEYSRCQDMSMTNLYHLQGSALIYCNGSTDYIEMRTYLGTSGTVESGSQSDTYMNGFLARSA